MFTLFYDDCDEVLATFGQKPEALALGKRLSAETGRPVTMLFTKEPGQSVLCCRFERGEKVEDAKCCPADYGTAGL